GSGGLGNPTTKRSSRPTRWEWTCRMSVPKSVLLISFGRVSRSVIILLAGAGFCLLGIEMLIDRLFDRATVLARKLLSVLVIPSLRSLAPHIAAIEFRQHITHEQFEALLGRLEVHPIGRAEDHRAEAARLLPQALEHLNRIVRRADNARATALREAIE